jgi:hypothetical protein
VIVQRSGPLVAAYKSYSRFCSVIHEGLADVYLHSSLIYFTLLCTVAFKLNLDWNLFCSLDKLRPSYKYFLFYSEMKLVMLYFDMTKTDDLILVEIMLEITFLGDSNFMLPYS